MTDWDVSPYITFCCGVMCWIVGLHGLMDVSGAAADTVPRSTDTAPLTLKEIVVTATPTPTPLAELGSSLTVVDEKEITRQEESFAAEALRHVPGVAIQRTGSPGGSRTRLRLRGAESKHTVVMIDGIEAPRERFGRTNSGYNLANLTTDDVERVEVLRGPQSVLYGSSAMAGVVNIITKTGSTEPSVDAGLKTGSFGTDKIRTGVEGPLLGGSFRMGFSSIDSDGFTTAAERFGNREEDGSNIDTFTGNFRAPLTSNLSFHGTFRLTDTNFEFDETNDPVGHPVDRDQFGESTERFGKLELSYRTWDGSLEHTLSRSFSDKDRDVFLQGLPTFILQDYEKPSWNYQINYGPRNGGTLTFGASTEEDEITKRTVFGTDQQTVTTDSVFGMYKFQPRSDLNMTLGVRHDWWEREGVLPDREGEETTYRATAAYFLVPGGTKLRASLGSAVNLPTFNQWVGTGGFPPGNAALEPEESFSWEVGMDFPLGSPGDLLELTYFRRTIDQYIRFPPKSLTQPPEQLDEFRTDGLELALTQQLTRGFSFGVTGTILSSEISGGVEPLQVPDLTGSLTLDYTPEERWNARLRLLYSGEKTDFTTESTPALRRRLTLGEYVVVNATGQLPVPYTRNVNLGIRVENLFDEQYENEYGFETPDRSLYLTLRSSF